MTMRPRTGNVISDRQRERRESKSRFPPLAVEPYTPPATAPDGSTGELQFPGLQELQALREENENLKRELLDKMRGHNKFISG